MKEKTVKTVRENRENRKRKPLFVGINFINTSTLLLDHCVIEFVWHVGLDASAP
jgi:hypothetical protein